MNQAHIDLQVINRLKWSFVTLIIIGGSVALFFLLLQRPVPNDGLYLCGLWGVATLSTAAGWIYSVRHKKSS
ncbi:hypothetical protein [Aureibacillus halotolerans]|uniref:YrhC-like protein n=1 Tax=Aureibacillus halotolerans TaxID=1508390 RepID=A0A4V3D4N4_9BACI|nr:hypothetical protein [Aureibacillus halotolerans]TDQ36967.1 hypothetical protein EV213_11560 [Aureibacillus halotolerans]